MQRPAADQRLLEQISRIPPPPGETTANTVRWCAGITAAFTLLRLILVVPGTCLGWDETVYVSQVGDHAPAAYFSAPGLVASALWWRP
ncbi:hypothetical protein [Streptomyces sp. TE5632]